MVITKITTVHIAKNMFNLLTRHFSCSTAFLSQDQGKTFLRELMHRVDDELSLEQETLRRHVVLATEEAKDLHAKWVSEGGTTPETSGKMFDNHMAHEQALQEANASYDRAVSGNNNTDIDLLEAKCARDSEINALITNTLAEDCRIYREHFQNSQESTRISEEDFAKFENIDARSEVLS